MTLNLNEHLEGIAFGIKFRANFSIEDNLGNIVDKILYSKDAYFNAEMFPMVHGGGNEKILSNDKKGYTLTINPSNIILDLQLNNKKDSLDIEEISRRFNADIVDGIMKDYKIVQIQRVGYIKKYLFKIEDFAEKVINSLLYSRFTDVKDINLSFSKKYPEEKALAVKDINDFYNVLYRIIKKIELNEIFISVDFQKIFEPKLENASQIKFPRFIEKVNSFNSHEISKWLNEIMESKRNG